MCLVCIPGGAVALIVVLFLLAAGMTVPLWLTYVLGVVAQALIWTAAIWLAWGVVRIAPDVWDAFASRRQQRAAAALPPAPETRARVTVTRVYDGPAALPTAGPPSLPAPPPDNVVLIFPTPRTELRR